jgi:lipopolysaccharide transport system ATP-binding protein
MSNTVIKVEGISKMYDLGLVGTGTLSKDLNRIWARWTGKPDPYAKIAELNDRTKKSESGSIWVLKDINFDVQQGEVLGIIGKNGAGKSTLLKILSKITAPTHGQIKIKGRVASLLEVGTGMHPEMTARQNIYLNGAIMGMRRHEITAKLDEIVDFAGIGKYIDTPIKRFSSGMQVRLGFAVAAFLEPEILIVDEVLAVGDAEFQKKAISKMQDVSKGEGRTILFVSHNMAAVKSLCTKAMIIEQGLVKICGGVTEMISNYLQGESELSSERLFKNLSHNGIKLLSIKICNESNNGFLAEDDVISFISEIEISDHNGNYYHITYQIFDENGIGICAMSNYVHDKLNLNPGKNKVICTMPSNFFRQGSYFVHLFFDINHRCVISQKDAIVFNIVTGKKELGTYMGEYQIYLQPKVDWKIY